MGDMLHGLGINVNFAPVVDVNVNPQSPAIGAVGRAFAADPHMVTRHGMAFGSGLAVAGVIPVYKHFPGYGSAGVDPHAEVTDVSTTWSAAELLPYQKIIAAARAAGTEDTN